MINIDEAFNNWLNGNYLFAEGMQTSRYSVEVNYRTEKNEILAGFAKIVLGYVSAAMKNCGYHCKTLFAEKPFRLFVSTRNWDDGEWVGVVCFNHKTHEFMIGKGTYNKDRNTVSITKIVKLEDKSAAEISKTLLNKMSELKKETPLNNMLLNPVRKKTGPKPKKIKGIKKSK